MTTSNVYDPSTETFEDDKALERSHVAMRDAGEQVEDTVFVDTFSFSIDEEYELPGTGGQTILFSRMNEGQKSDFQKQTNKDVRIQRTTGDARMQVDPASERHALIRISVTGWTLKKRDHKGNIVGISFDQKLLKEWMMSADPKFVQGLEKAIRESNEWMKNEMTTEEIDREIENLKEQKVRLEEDNAKKESS